MKRVLVVLAVLIASPLARAQAPAPDGGTPPATPAKPAKPCPDPPRLNPTGKALMKIAECNAAAGLVATAWKQFRQAANAAGRDRKTSTLAQERAEAMTKLIPRMTIDVPTDLQVSVTIDGTSLPPEQFGAPLAIDPGAHVVRAETEDAKFWEQTVDVPIRENVTVKVQQPRKKIEQPLKGTDTQPGNGTGTEPGNGTGAQPGNGTGTEPGKGTGTEPGKEPPKGETPTLEVVDPVAYDHTRAPKYKAYRAEHAPSIDGVLDDDVWKKAPSDKTFYLETSKPYGLPTDEPTSIQIAYDARALYVAVTMSYATPHEPDDSPPLSETDLREFIGVYVDSAHDHSTAYAFALTPDGYKSDWEIWNNGDDANFQWAGVWEAKTSINKKGWTAEYAIPWGTVGFGSTDVETTIGINFRRLIGQGASRMSWSLSPPGSPRPLPSFAGHLEGINNTDLTRIVTLVPYIAAGWSSLPTSYRDAPEPSWLRNLDRRGTPYRIYGGLYGRFQFGRGAGADFVVNPDFSQVTPDAALANLDRFELFFPEVRDFFVNSASTFAFGPERYQLFYSRRIGLRRRLNGFDEVPIWYGVNATVRKGSTTVSVLEVYNGHLPGPVESGGRRTEVLAAHTLVARALQVFGPSKIGAMALNQTGLAGIDQYKAAGTDGVLSVYKNHLVLSGFGAYSSKQEIIPGYSGPATYGKEIFHNVSGFAWQTAATFKAQELELDASYTNVGREFRADLGFFERVAAHRSDLGAYYRPQVHSDLIHSVTVGLTTSRLVDQSMINIESPISTRFNTILEARLLDAGSLSFTMSQVNETVGDTFYVANNRIGIQAGNYSGNQAVVAYRSAPGEHVEYGLTYVDGYYFGGTQRLITPTMTLNFRKMAATFLYTRYRLVGGPTAILSDAISIIDGDRLSMRLLYAWTPDLRVAAALEANTLDPTATSQLVALWRLNALSTISLVANRSAPSVGTWGYEPINSVLVKFAYGVTAP